MMNEIYAVYKLVKTEEGKFEYVDWKGNAASLGGAIALAETMMRAAGGRYELDGEFTEHLEREGEWDEISLAYLGTIVVTFKRKLHFGALDYLHIARQKMMDWESRGIELSPVGKMLLEQYSES